MKNANGTNREKWNREIIARGGSLLQSWEWGELQHALGRTIHRIPELPALLISMPLPLGMWYDYSPHGPHGDTLNGEVLHELAAHTRSVRALFLRAEPRVADTPRNRGVLAHAGFRQAPDVQPRETMLIDLRKSEEDLLRAMEHDTRYAIRAAEKRGVVVECAGGPARHPAFAHFWELFEATNARHGLHAYEKRYYEAVASLDGDAETEIIIASLPAQAGGEGQVLAAAIVAYFGTTAYYLYAASRAGYGKYNAPSLLLFEIIRRAKARGHHILDLWGASGTKKEWAGVTAFKKSFGGTARTFVGTWDYVYQPLWYLVYRLAARFR